MGGWAVEGEATLESWWIVEGEATLVSGWAVEGVRLHLKRDMFGITQFAKMLRFMSILPFMSDKVSCCLIYIRKNVPENLL